jgi:phosphohistidine phosphatase
MQILLVRHAIAADGAAFAGADADRPLTEDGRRRFERGARALAALVPELGLVATSPLRRARETAEILASAFDARIPVATAAALAPGAPGDAVVHLLDGWRDRKTVALVGHEPDLTRLEGLLLTGRERSLAELKKGGAALLDLPDRIEAGAARLVWHLTAGQLRELAP